MHSSLSSLASRLESIESALYGTAVTSPFGAEAPSVSAKSRKFEKSALARLSAASAVLDSNLSLDAKLDFKKCDLLLNGLGSMAPVALPTPAQQEILASCSGDVTTIAAQLQAIQELSEVALNSKVIAGACAYSYLYCRRSRRIPVPRRRPLSPLTACCCRG